MEYRQIGNTGVMASILGMGGEHLDGKPYPQVEATVRAALDAGALLLTTGELSAVMGGEHYGSKAALIADLPKRLRRGDVVLVKASHSMAFEEISEALREIKL